MVNKLIIRSAFNFTILVFSNTISLSRGNKSMNFTYVWVFYFFAYNSFSIGDEYSLKWPR